MQQQKNSIVHFAGKLAAKEAVYKVLKLNWNEPFNWKKIAIYNNKNGIPEVYLIDIISDEMQNKKIKVSISHTNEYAVAAALLIKGEYHG